MYIFAQLAGFLAIAVSFVIYQQKKRSRVILFKLLADLLWISNFLLIGGYTGALTTSVSVAREIAFYKSNKKIWLYIFWVLYIFSAVITWKDCFSIFPTLGSIITTFAFWNKKVKNFKLLSVPVSIFYFIYNLHIGSLAGITNEVLTLSSLFISLVIKKEYSKNG